MVVLGALLVAPGAARAEEIGVIAVPLAEPPVPARDVARALGAAITASNDRPHLDPVEDARRIAAAGAVPSHRLEGFVRARALIDEGWRAYLQVSFDFAAARLGQARSLAEDVAAGRLQPAQIDEAVLGTRVALADLPAPDLFIRTGGDYRISNFLLWQLAYTELWFTETLWPELDTAVLHEALRAYAGRERRFGLTGEQVAGRARPDLQGSATP